MTGHDIIVIGASAGGVEALKQLVSLLPKDLPAAIFVVMHVPPHGTSVLPKILTRAGALRAMHAQNGQQFENGRIYIAPPDFHLLLKRGYMILTRGPKENRSRPAVDPLFRTAAHVYGKRVTGVILSGALDDGTAGLLAVKMRGGIAIVQDPADAMYSGMPINAIENVEVDYILPVSEIAPVLSRLTQQPVPEEVIERDPEGVDTEIDMAEMDNSTSDVPPGSPAVFACPECGGTLWEHHDGDLIRFRCRVGHAYTAQSLLADQMEAIEDAFWVALRALEESAALARRMAERARERGQMSTVEQFEGRAKDAGERAEVIRRVLQKGIFDPQATSDKPDENYAM